MESLLARLPSRLSDCRDPLAVDGRLRAYYSGARFAEGLTVPICKFRVGGGAALRWCVRGKTRTSTKSRPRVGGRVDLALNLHGGNAQHVDDADLRREVRRRLRASSLQRHLLAAPFRRRAQEILGEETAGAHSGTFSLRDVLAGSASLGDSARPSWWRGNAALLPAVCRDASRSRRRPEKKPGPVNAFLAVREPNASRRTCCPMIVAGPADDTALFTQFQVLRNPAAGRV